MPSLTAPTVSPAPPPELRPALVVFEHRDATGPMRFLAPGFRHCFCLLRERGGWLLCDPLKGGLVLRLLPPHPFGALRRHFVETRRHVAAGRAPVEPSPDARWPKPCTCVEVVKRALGLRAPLALTPRQLFEFLKMHEDWVAEHPKPLDGATI